MAEDDTYVPLDKCAKAYVTIRDRLKKMQDDFDAEVEALKAQQDKIRFYMMEEMKKLGSTSLKTNEGTIMMSVKTRYFTNDWDAFKQFVLDNEVPDLYERRIAQKNMAEWLKNNPKKVPAGLNSEASYDVSVRKNS
jgi:hypothetical protein